MKKQLDRKAVWLFFINNFLSCLIILTVFVICPLSFAFLEYSSNVEIVIIFVGSVLFLLLFIIFAYVWALLMYKNYWYELTDNSFRKEYGVIAKKYVSIPYARIQNVDIYRGLLSRIIGLSDLNIQTAGASIQTVAGEGRLPAISQEDAEELRDELIKRASGPSGV